MFIVTSKPSHYRMIDDAQIEGFTSTVFSLCTEKNVHFERATFFCSVNKDSIGGQWGSDPRDSTPS